METAMTGLTDAAFAAGLKIYTKGGNSGSYAKLTLAAAITTMPLPKAGDAVTGIDSAAGAVTGRVLDAYTAGSTTLTVAYDVSDVQITHSRCRVGGLSVPITTGCKCIYTV
jgi:hypothetical protein